MKKVKKGIYFIMLLGLFNSACSKEEIEVETPMESQLTTAELAMLHYMMEEEKLAYDVYITLYQKYGTAIFNNISKSELTHIEAVNKLLEKYNIPNTASNTVGVYNIEHIQELYDGLIASGNISLVEALKVGATIEDVDIFDLENYLGETENADIISVFDFLNCGSRNHLRGFMLQLEAQGADYTPQFITQERFDEILNHDHEICASYTLD